MSMHISGQGSSPNFLDGTKEAMFGENPLPSEMDMSSFPPQSSRIAYVASIARRCCRLLLLELSRLGRAKLQ